MPDLKRKTEKVTGQGDQQQIEKERSTADFGGRVTCYAVPRGMSVGVRRAYRKISRSRGRG